MSKTLQKDKSKKKVFGGAKWWFIKSRKLILNFGVDKF